MKPPPHNIALYGVFLLLNLYTQRRFTIYVNNIYSLLTNMLCWFCRQYICIFSFYKWPILARWHHSAFSKRLSPPTAEVKQDSGVTKPSHTLHTQHSLHAAHLLVVDRVFGTTEVSTLEGFWAGLRLKLCTDQMEVVWSQLWSRSEWVGRDGKEKPSSVAKLCL